MYHQKNKERLVVGVVRNPLIQTQMGFARSATLVFLVASVVNVPVIIQLLNYMQRFVEKPRSTTNEKLK